MTKRASRGDANRRTGLAAAVVMVTAACGSVPAARVAAPTTPVTHEEESAVAEEAEPIDVANAALPFAVLRGDGGAEVATEGFFAELSGVQAVCVGEGHTNVHDHWAQLQILDRLTAHNRDAGISTGLGFEMFQRPVQGVLDDYVKGGIDEATMLTRTGWKKRWGYDYDLYKPMVDLARVRGADLLALNTAKELIKQVSKQGLEAMAEIDRAKLPELDLDNARHRAWFTGLMAKMGGAAGHSAGGMGKKKMPPPASEEDKAAAKAEARARAERIYTAQVVWDETMADSAAKWLAAGTSRQVIILAGSGHCHDSGIVARLKRRGIERAVSVRPIVDDGEGNIAEILTEARNDYVFVMSKPESD